MHFRQQVAHHRQVEGLRHGGNLHPLRDATGAQHVDHWNINRAGFHHVAERHQPVEILAAGQRCGERLGHPGEALEIVAGGHVFEPVEAHFLETLADGNRLAHIPALVDVAHQVDAGADGGADRTRTRDFDLGGGRAGQGQLHLHLGEAALDQARGRALQHIRWGRAHQGTTGIGGHRLAQAAQQRRYRYTERLALDVPQCNVDRGEREGIDAAGAGRTRRRRERLGDQFHLERVQAQGERAERINRSLQGAGQRAAEEGEADALDAFVSADPQRDEVICRAKCGRAVGQWFFCRQAHDARLDMGDFHVGLRLRVGSISCLHGVTLPRRVAPANALRPVPAIESA